MKRTMVIGLVFLLVLFSCDQNSYIRSPEIIPLETLPIEQQEVITVNDVQAYKDEVFRLANVEREKRNIPPFQKGNQKLERAANLRALEIVSRFEHLRLDGRDLKTILSDVGISQWKVFAENLATNSVHYHTPQDTINQWMNSEGHRIALLHPDYRYMSVGYTEEGNQAYIVQLFISYLD